MLARITTRDKVDFRKKYYHYFYAPNLINLLFKKLELNGESVMRSRYHAEYPLAVKNPLNKEIIVGEVEFYLIQTAQITSGKHKNVSESINAEEIRLD